MTVYRLGIDASDHKAPTRTHLGRILVTIDDLRTLMEMLKKVENDTKGVIIEFAGGTFDNADDLRELSDVEMRTLSVKSSRIDVRLGAYSAIAVGDNHVGAYLRKNWAEQRATKVPPRAIQRKIQLRIQCGAQIYPVDSHCGHPGNGYAGCVWCYRSICS